MDGEVQRAALRRLIDRDGTRLATLSRAIGRNAAWVQQYLRRGSPKLLPERERGAIARFFGVGEDMLGGPAPPPRVARLDLTAAAGPGRLVGLERATPVSLPVDWAALGVDPDRAGLLTVAGDSMEPGLRDGDRILVDRARRDPAGALGAIWVVREGDALLVKRLAREGRGWRVISDNAPERRVALRDLEVIGRVVWLDRRL